MTEPLGIKSTVSHYRILSKLGAGGMGEVYLAEDTSLDRKVAIKFLPAEFTKDPDRVRRFEQEAKAVSALNHPHIITIHEIGEAEAGRFIVMELVQGRTLRSIDKPCPLDMLAGMGNQIARALAVAHAAGITHRDIKPENIMVRDDGYAKILDFGLARLIPGTSADPEAVTLAFQTTPGTLLGTIAYMSPEQARGEIVTPATDVFALGIVLFELATGQHPFKAETIVGILHSITSQAPLTPSRANPDLPAALESLILRMLEKEATRRPSAVEVAEVLAELSGQCQLQRPATSAATSGIARHTVGRAKERADLLSGFSSALAGRGQLLCVTGEPGVGKTTLVEDFLTDLAAGGQCTIARGRCSERLAGTEAYLPLVEALENLLRSGVNPAAACLMKQIAPTWYAQAMPLSGSDEESARLLAEVKAASQERMKRELGAFLQEVARSLPLVLFFDDLHWADVSTIDLLSFLARKFDALNVLILVTYRPSDMLLAKHPFLQIKPDLQARGFCRELALDFLTQTEIEHYLALEFPGHSFPAGLPKMIHAKTEGSPLFMVDLVRYLRDRGVIALEDGADDCASTWTLVQALPDIERELPESVRGMIERKIAQLGEEDLKLLTAASVQGYEFDSSVVAQVLHVDADPIEERLEKLERVFAFVKLTSEAEFPNRELTMRYRFVHVLYQNTLYAGLRLTRKTSLSAAVAQSLEGFYGNQSALVANELAVLWETAREYARAADYFHKAARNASQINAQQEAIQLARRGLEALQRLPESAERYQQELGLQLALGLSLSAVQGWTSQEAEKSFTRARTLCQQAGNDPRLFAALRGLWVRHMFRAEYKAGSELADQLLQLAKQTGDPLLLASACYGVGFTLYPQGEITAALDHFERALALHDPGHYKDYLALSSEEPGLQTRRGVAFCLWKLGFPDRALKGVQENLNLAERLAHPYSLGGALFGFGVVCAWRKEWQASQNQYEKGLALSRETELGGYRSWMKISHDIAQAYQLPTEATVAEARRSLEFIRANGVEMTMTTWLAYLAELSGMVNHVAEGLDLTTEALARIERTGERFWEAEVWRIRGDLVLRADSPSLAEAESCFQKALEVALQQRARSLELRATMSLARLWREHGKIAEALPMLAEIYYWFTEGFDTADLRDAKALLDELKRQEI